MDIRIFTSPFLLMFLGRHRIYVADSDSSDSHQDIESKFAKFEIWHNIQKGLIATITIIFTFIPIMLTLIVYLKVRTLSSKQRFEAYAEQIQENRNLLLLDPLTDDALTIINLYKNSKNDTSPPSKHLDVNMKASQSNKCAKLAGNVSQELSISDQLLVGENSVNTTSVSARKNYIIGTITIQPRGSSVTLLIKRMQSEKAINNKNGATQQDIAAGMHPELKGRFWQLLTGCWTPTGRI
ncbi:hypothetical protein DAPPUDRAFT_105154 [Daphnia pulex]|uniref:Uncharacterized protein n=1 Tax=Daphnia pulex TaxID=6669 RepID=E9GPN5_DAPPU|nr:hypothetical protein DAPPUDRAFT_105154 [Daphnia pulex]|eukprot:EFX78555.1 hypothetical protein DAPPUDRAFT_105154 [Daphnia pulex]